MGYPLETLQTGDAPGPSPNINWAIYTFGDLGKQNLHRIFALDMACS